MKREFINEVVCIGDRVYFTSSYGNVLYMIDKDRSISEIDKVVFSSNGLPKACKIFGIHNHIIIVPSFENELFDYNLITGNLVKHSVPNVERADKGFPLFRDACMIGDKIWMLPQSSRCIACFDVSKGDIYTYDYYSSKISINSQATNLFYNMSIGPNEDDLVLFGNESDVNICFDTINMNFQVCDIPFINRYGLFLNGCWIESPKMADDKIKIYDMNGEVVKEVPIPKEYLSYSLIQEYWYVRNTNSYAVLCPYSSTAVAIVSYDFDVKFVEIGTVAGSDCIVWDAVDYDDGIILLSENKPLTLYIDSNMEVKKIYFGLEKIDSFNSMNSGIYREILPGDLREFLSELS